MILSKKNILLFGSILFLLIGLWRVVVLTIWPNDFNTYIKKVQSRFDDYYDQVEEVEERILATLSDDKDPAFSSFINTNIPYHILKNDTLIFWSDNKLTLADTTFNSTQGFALYYDDFSGYISKKTEYEINGDRYQIINYLPIFKKYFVENKYLKSGLNQDLFKGLLVRILPNPYVATKDIRGPNGEYLFSLSNQQKKSTINHEDLLFALFLICLSIFLFIAYSRIRENISKVRCQLFSYGIFILFILIRLVFLFTRSDFTNHIPLFDTSTFQSSFLAPSMGDFMVNLFLFSFFLWSILLPKNSKRIYDFVSKQTPKIQLVVRSMCLLICFFTFYYFISGLYSVNNAPELYYDITKDIQVNQFKIAYVIIFILLSYNYFITNHFIINLLPSKKKDKRQLFYIAGIVLFLGVLGLIIFPSYYRVPLLIHLVYLFMSYQYRMNIFTREVDRKLYRYFVLFNLICSLIGAWCVYDSTRNKSVENKRQFAEKILKDGDIQGEYLLNELNKKIRQNEFVKRQMLSPLSNKSLISQAIKKSYLEEYFEKYDIKVNVFDVQGNALYTEGMKQTVYDYVLEYSKNNYETNYPDLYFVNHADHQNSYQYVLFIPISKNNSFIGDVVLELELKKVVANSIYPKLLLDDHFQSNLESSTYQYCIFYGDKIEYSYGDFDYHSLKNTFFTKTDKIHGDGIYIDGYHHLMVSTGDLNHIVVSTETNGLKIFYSNYSFLFILWTFVLLLILIGRIIYDRVHKIKINYSAKIQLYYNIAFFLPLLIISVTVLSVIDSFYLNDLTNNFKSKVLQISSTMNELLEDNNGDIHSIDKLHDKVENIAKSTGTDINIYDSDGMMVSTSQPLIYESKLLSGNINPTAYVDVIDNNKNITILQEKIGTLTYEAFYASLTPYSKSNVQAIISIPFFNVTTNISYKRVSLFTTVVNIFSSLFILLLLLSYLTSKALTEPLGLISAQMQKFSLSGKNEPLKWNSEDEIGMLVQEYNQMMLNLEQSKSELEKTKKEEAWREMAQQVAHEIKNPLTPMKLTLQHMQRITGNEEGSPTKKSIETLLNQIDTLSDIATSFSSFAKMPIPKRDKFNVINALNNTLDLYRNTGEVDLKEDIFKDEVEVMGDQKLMGRIFTNLIINAIQSVPSHRTPELNVLVESTEKIIRISFKDNGSGIPAEIQNKVFVPNFSTKYAGSGLGLAVAKRGVNHAGGDIWFETSSEGTTFFIELPIS